MKRNRTTLLLLFATILLALPAVQAVDSQDLIQIVKTGQLKLLQAMILEPDEINRVKGPYGESLLQLAVEEKQAGAAQWLIQHGADVNAKDSSSRTPLYKAVESSSVDLIRMLISNKAEFLEVEPGANILHVAANSGNAETMRVCLEYQIDINAQNSDGSTPLFVAADHSNVEAVELLLDHNADVHLANRYTGTPLHAAAGAYSYEQEKNYRIAQLLLENGANPEAVNDYGAKPYHKARSWAMYFLLAWPTTIFWVKVSVALLSATLLTLIPIQIARSVARNHPIKRPKPANPAQPAA